VCLLGLGFVDVGFLGLGYFLMFGCFLLRLVGGVVFMWGIFWCLLFFGLFGWFGVILGVFLPFLEY